MIFSFAANKKMIFGPEETGNLGKYLPSLASPSTGPLLLISGKTVAAGARWKNLSRDLTDRGYSLIHEIVSGEPSPQLVDDICARHREEQPALVAALGGGSVLDAGKAVSAMLCEGGSVRNFLEGVGTKAPSGKKLPFAALPTTAGTGSECTKNAVLSSPGPDGFKKSLRHDNYIPDLALVDPLWLEDLPRDIAASCGMDAFFSAARVLLFNGGIPCHRCPGPGGPQGFFLFFFPSPERRHLPGMTSRPSPWGATLSGLTLANAGLGTVHGLAGTLGGDR